MDLSTWTTRNADAVRMKRLFAGGVVGVMLLVAGGAFIVLTSTHEAAAKEEDIVAVELAREPEPEPEPEPAPEPPPPVEKAAPAARPGPRLPKLEVPTEVSNDKPEEKDPAPNTGTGDPLQGATPGGGGTDPKAPEAAVVEPPKPTVPPKPAAKKPVRISEDMPPPVVLEDVAPSYPPEARAAGIEGVVAVRVLVGTDGVVKSTKVLKGPPELAPACEAAAKQWRFKPYLLDGEPTAFVKMKICRYRLR
jgi:protein TonB